MAGMENRFGASAPFTVGVEEEFQLIDPSTRELASVIEDVIGAAPDTSERMARELFQDCVEMRTPVFSKVGERARKLPALRLGVAKKAGVGVVASGLDSISDTFLRRFISGRCHERMEEDLDELARLQIIYALSVAVPDAVEVIRVKKASLSVSPSDRTLGKLPFLCPIAPG